MYSAPIFAGNPVAPSVGSGPSAAIALRFGKKEENADTFVHLHQEQPEQFSTAERLKSAVSKAFSAVIDWKRVLLDLVIGAGLAVATFWLPGSQILTIPAYLAISAAFRAMFGAADGWKNPSSKNATDPGRVMMLPVST